MKAEIFLALPRTLVTSHGLWHVTATVRFNRFVDGNDRDNGVRLVGLHSIKQRGKQRETPRALLYALYSGIRRVYTRRRTYILQRLESPGTCTM